MGRDSILDTYEQVAERYARERSQALQYQGTRVHGAKHYLILHDQDARQVEFAHEAGTISNVHVGIDADSRFGHDFIDIHPAGCLIFGQYLARNI